MPGPAAHPASPTPAARQPRQTSVARRAAPECPEPPAFLTGYAADVWYRVAPELRRIGLLTSIDLMTLVVYCDSYERWRSALETLARMAEADLLTHALLIKTTDGHPRRNRLAKIASGAASDMVAYAGLFGMTPAARSRIVASIGGQPDGKFSGLLA